MTTEAILDPGAEEAIPPVPRISLQAFCETAGLAETIAIAAEDRRMDRAHVRVHMGGAPAAVESYRSAPTPNVVVLEAATKRDDILNNLDQLAEVCDATTRVIVVGRVNDIVLYRELMARGVSDYLIQPIDVIDVVRSVSRLYSADGAKPVGRLLAVIGAKGGCGASTVAHNIAWAVSRQVEIDTCLVDMDIAFGTAGLDFNQDPPQGIADAVASPDRVDQAFIDRLLARCSEHLSLLAAPATLDRTCDYNADTFDPVFDNLRNSVPTIVVDIPHVWTAWTKRVLTTADDILVVCAPDLANLRNAKNMIDLLRTLRPNDRPARYCLNMVGMPKRPEIKPADFAKALEAEPATILPFDPQLFGTAANNGQMIDEIEPGHKIAQQFGELALAMTGRAEIRKPKNGLSARLIERLSMLRKKA
ncbi:MAG: AAA family ATPase [Alphaproteobacteria bacterium]|jgi:pilus assembly protein CpaE